MTQVEHHTSSPLFTHETTIKDPVQETTCVQETAWPKKNKKMTWYTVLHKFARCTSPGLKNIADQSYAAPWYNGAAIYERAKNRMTLTSSSLHIQETTTRLR